MYCVPYAAVLQRQVFRGIIAAAPCRSNSRQLTGKPPGQATQRRMPARGSRRRRAVLKLGVLVPQEGGRGLARAAAEPADWASQGCSTRAQDPRPRLRAGLLSPKAWFWRQPYTLGYQRFLRDAAMSLIGVICAPFGSISGHLAPLCRLMHRCCPGEHSQIIR